MRFFFLALLFTGLSGAAFALDDNPTLHVIDGDGRLRPAPDGSHRAPGGIVVETRDGRIQR
ncbi:MAG: hypothetical protein ACK5O1_07430 [Holosporales bacterium]|jgi:hypothetical protein